MSGAIIMPEKLRARLEAMAEEAHEKWAAALAGKLAGLTGRLPLVETEEKKRRTRNDLKRIKKKGPPGLAGIRGAKFS